MKERERATIRFHYNLRVKPEWRRYSSVDPLLCLDCGAVLFCSIYPSGRSAYSTFPFSLVLYFVASRRTAYTVMRKKLSFQPISAKIWLLVSHPQALRFLRRINPLDLLRSNRWSFSRYPPLLLSFFLCLSVAVHRNVWCASEIPTRHGHPVENPPSNASDRFLGRRARLSFRTRH